MAAHRTIGELYRSNEVQALQRRCLCCAWLKPQSSARFIFVRTLYDLEPSLCTEVTRRSTSLVSDLMERFLWLLRRSFDLPRNPGAMTFLSLTLSSDAVHSPNSVLVITASWSHPVRCCVRCCADGVPLALQISRCSHS